MSSPPKPPAGPVVGAIALLGLTSALLLCNAWQHLQAAPAANAKDADFWERAVKTRGKVVSYDTMVHSATKAVDHYLLHIQMDDGLETTEYSKTLVARDTPVEGWDDLQTRRVEIRAERPDASQLTRGASGGDWLLSALLAAVGLGLGAGALFLLKLLRDVPPRRP